jgi:hypothetical protein
MSISSTAEWIGRQHLKTLDEILPVHSSNSKKGVIQPMKISEESVRQEDGSNRSTSDTRSIRENTDGCEHVEEEDEGFEGDDDDDDDNGKDEDDEPYYEDENLGKLNDVSFSHRNEIPKNQNFTHARKGDLDPDCKGETHSSEGVENIEVPRKLCSLSCTLCV